MAHPTQGQPTQPGITKSGSQDMGPVKAVQALHQLVKSCARPQDEPRLMAAVSLLATPKERVTKADHVDSLGSLTRALIAKVDGAEGALTKHLTRRIEGALRVADVARHTEIQTLRAELQRLRARSQPLSGQPVVRVTSARRSTKADAAAYLAKAAETSDPTLRRGYTVLANNLNDRN